MSLPTILMPTYQSPSAQETPRATRAARRVRTTTKVSSDTSPFYDDDKWKIFVTTESQICSWNSKGLEPVFTSSSRGIVAAKHAQDGSTLAIADAQVILLRKVKDGQDKSYRLRGTQRCRLLQYSHDGSSLFYTDAFHNSVQAYSLSERRVTDAAKSHPSPISTFAISCDSNLILSASADPPVIQIHNQLHATTISLAPSESAAPVVTCAFHPSRKHIFVLAFGDGVLAAYDYNNLSKAKQENPLDIPRCYPKAMHAFKHLHDPSVVGSAGITGVEFIPGHRSRAITVGEDGRCFLVDFEQGSVVGSWHIGAPATSLSMRDIKQGPANRKKELGGFLIAIGTVHGRCVIYDGNANKVAEKAINTEGDAVLDVEWVYGDVPVPDGDMYSSPEPPSSPVKAASKKEAPAKNRRTRAQKPAINSLYENGKNPSISLPPPLEETDHNVGVGAVQVDKKRGYVKPDEPPEQFQEVAEATEGYMGLFSPVKKKRAPKPASLPEKKAEKVTKPSDPRLRAAAESSDHRSAISAPQLWDDPVKKGKPKKKEEEPKKKEEAQPLVEEKRDVFDVFQADNRDQTTAEETLNSQGASVYNLTSVTTEPVKMSESTTDGKLLSEIRSIRAKVESGRASRAANSTLALTSQYLPSRSRTQPVSRVGTVVPDPKSGKAVSLQEGNVLPSSSQDTEAIDSSVLPPTGTDGHETGHETGHDTAHDTVTDLPGLNTDETQPDFEDTVLPADKPEEDGADDDIWLAAASKRTRKRKMRSRIGDESISSSGLHPGSNIELTHDSSTIRSTKSRKTVTITSSSQATVSNETARSVEPAKPQPLPTPQASMSEDTTVAKPVSSTNATSGSDHPSQVVTAARSRLVPRRPAPTPESALDTSIRGALAEMQAAMVLQMQTMQDEMQRQFRAQNRELLALHNEVGRVREENGELRKMLLGATGKKEESK
ncbi:hypothetical protein EDC01DRAFT_627568 [Geopyxis carbonaria]|nr:hypothetical protein EDC01DRAFT_627568 [Geopyxis carbonaria]